MAFRFVVQTISTFCCFWITAGQSTSDCTVYDFDGKNRSNVFECESPGIISCKVTANSAFIQWFIADPIEPSTPVACQCFGSSCTSFNDFSGRYAYTYNQGDGIANITIRNISSADRGLKYKINDGTLPRTFEPITKVFPDKITASINFTDDKGTQNVTLSTDCTLLSKNITFVWQKTRNSSGAELEHWAQDDVKLTEITNLDDTLCTSTHTCGNIGNIIFSSTLIFKPGNSGDAYYLHCTVVVNDEYGPPNKIWISSNSYQLKEIINSKEEVRDGKMLVAILGSLGCVIILSGIGVIICCGLLKKKKPIRQENDGNCIHVPSRTCIKSFPCFPKTRVIDGPVPVEPIVLYTAATATSITCTWKKEFKSNQVVHLSYTNIQTIEQKAKLLNDNEKQNRSCTINDLQSRTLYNLVMKAKDTRNQTEEKSESYPVKTTGTNDASEMQRTGQKLNTTVLHMEYSDQFRISDTHLSLSKSNLNI